MSCAKSISVSLSWGCMLLSGGLALAAPQVTTLKIPNSGYRPQVILDGQGTLHVVYTQMDKRGELFYIQRKAGQEEFTRPIKVNSTPGCAAGFNMTVGKGRRVHVIIRPTAIYSRDRLKRRPKFRDLKYMLYCRLNDEGTAFEDERDLSGTTFGFEGVGTLLADGKGMVRAFWHGLSKPGPESTRQIFLAVSEDEGKTFTGPQAVEMDVEGACACCSMQGTMDAEGNLYLGFRNSEKSLTKDSYLLTSKDGGRRFKGTLLDPWANAGCPGSTYSLTSGSSGVYVAWRTRSEVSFARGGAKPERIDAPTSSRRSRSPVVVANSRGDVLFAWSEAANLVQLKSGGDLAWVIYDRNGNPLSTKKTLPAAVARWSLPAAYAKPDGDFVIYFDGPGAGR